MSDKKVDTVKDAKRPSGERWVPEVSRGLGILALAGAAAVGTYAGFQLHSANMDRADARSAVFAGESGQPKIDSAEQHEDNVTDAAIVGVITTAAGAYLAGSGQIGINKRKRFEAQQQVSLAGPVAVEAQVPALDLRIPTAGPASGPPRTEQ